MEPNRIDLAEQRMIVADTLGAIESMLNILDNSLTTNDSKKGKVLGRFTDKVQTEIVKLREVYELNERN